MWAILELNFFKALNIHVYPDLDLPNLRWIKYIRHGRAPGFLTSKLNFSALKIKHYVINLHNITLSQRRPCIANKGGGEGEGGTG